MEAEGPRVPEAKTPDADRPVQKGRSRMRRVAAVLGTVGALAGAFSLAKGGGSSAPEAPAPFSISTSASEKPVVSSKPSESSPVVTPSPAEEPTKKEGEKSQVLHETLKKLGINMALLYQDDTFDAEKNLEKNGDNNVTITMVRKAGNDTYELQADMQQEADGKLLPETVSTVEIAGLKGPVDERDSVFDLEISEMPDGAVSFEYNCKDKDPQIGTSKKGASEDPFVDNEGMQKVSELANELLHSATENKTVPQTPPQLVI